MYWFEGVRLQSASPSVSYGAGNNLNLDNIGIRIYASDNSPSDKSLSTALAAKDLTKWDKNAANPTGSLPAVAKVDGEYVYSLAALQSVFDSTVFPVDVEILREFKKELTVNCDATVETHGLTGTLTPGGNVTVKDAGTIKTFDAVNSSETVNNCPNNNYTADIIAAVSDGTLMGMTSSQNYGTYINRTLVTDKLTGNKYLDFRSVTAANAEKFHQYTDFFPVSDDSGKRKTSDKLKYADGMLFVVDFDVFVDGEVLADMYVNISPRNSSGASKAAANSKLPTWNLPAGEWSHLTMVYDVTNNKGYFYVNNALSKTVDQALWSNGQYATLSAAKADGLYFDALRFNVYEMTQTNENQHFAIDNFGFRCGITDEWLSANRGAASLTGWTANKYNSDYVLPSIPAVATVDGNVVSSTKELNDALGWGDAAKDVVLYRKPNGKIAVNCDATVDTRGYAVPTAGTSATVSNEGNVYTFDAPFVQSLSLSDRVLSYGTAGLVSILKAKHPDNIFNKMQWDSTMSGDGGLRGYVATNLAVGNKYVYIKRPVSEPKDTYFELQSMTDLTYNANVNQYMVFDFDYAQITDGTVPYYTIPRNGSAGLWGHTSPTLNQLVDGYAKGDFQHITMVYDMNANKGYAFVNGNLFGSSYTYTSADNHRDHFLKGQTINFNGIRLGANSTAGFAVGGVNIRHVTVPVSDASENSLTAALAASNISVWSDATTDVITEMAPIASVNGQYFASASSLQAALSGGENLTVHLDRDFDETVKIASTATINTHGIKNFISPAPGFYIEDNGNGTISVIKDERVGNVTVNINSTKVINVDLPYGTDFAAYMSENHINMGGVIVVGYKVYTGAKWTTAPGIVNAENTVYNVTATECSDDFVVINTSTNQDVTTQYADLGAALAGTIDKIIILNKDYRGNNATISNKTTVYMLGHTIGFTNGGVHHFQMAYSANPTFIGGSIVDDSATTTYSLFFAHYGFSGEIKLVNCQVYGISHIATMRGGTFTAENSTITVPMYQNTYPFEVADYFNGHTRTKVTLNLIDCKIKYTAINSSVSAALINAKDIDKYYSETSADEKNKIDTDGAKTLVNEVNISGCTISIPKDASLLTVTECKDETPNVKFNIDNTELFVKNLQTNTYNTVTIGEGVKSAAALTGVGVNFATGVEEINSGNAMLPYAYSSSYATVTWSDGTTEKWADGSVPVNAACKSDSVRPVVAGETVTFTNSGFAPALKGNMTLNANLIFNLYVPKANAQEITKVTIGDVHYVIDGNTKVVQVANADHYVFEYVMSPEVAAQTFTIVVENASGKIVSKNMSIAQYATRAEEVVPGSANLVKSLLAYVAEAHKYTSNYVNGFDAVDDYANPTAVELPNSGTNTIKDNLSAYITSAQLNLNYGPKWRFNVKDGADISGLTVHVDNELVEYTIGDGYIEVELPAYKMGEVITITVGEVSGQYDLAAYYAAQAALAASITLINNRIGSGSRDAARALESLNLIKAFYTYVYYASAYKA